MLRNFLFQYSLRSLLLIMLLIGVGGGFWMGKVQPIKKQWRAAGIIFDNGGTIETKEANFPALLKWTMPTGQTDHVLAVHIDHKPVSDLTVRALQDLPRLERLYLERTELKPSHIDRVAQLPSVKRLSIWGNDQLKNSDIAKLASMESLRILDISKIRSLTWKCLIPFITRPEVEVRHLFYNPVLDAGDAHWLIEIPRLADTVSYVKTHGLQAKDIAVYFNGLKKLKSLRVYVDRNFDERLLPKLINAEPGNDLYMYFSASPHSPTLVSDQKKILNILLHCWNDVGPKSQRILLTNCGNSRIFVEFDIKLKTWSRRLNIHIMLDTRSLDPTSLEHTLNQQLCFLGDVKTLNSNITVRGPKSKLSTMLRAKLLPKPVR